MMSRHSKKGFKKLNTHELVELNHGRADSGSESEILDLTTVDEHEPRSSCCSSCCIWFTVLYMGVLTVLLMLVAAFSGYILVTTWQLNQDSNFTTTSLQADLRKLRDDFERNSRETYYMMNGLKETTFEVNTSYTTLNTSLNSTLDTVMSRMTEIEAVLKKIQETPKEVLIEQIDAIHKEMAILDENMNTLNRSLDELQEVRKEMASMSTVLTGYDVKLKELGSSIGDTLHTNTDMQDSIQGLADRVGILNTTLRGIDERVNKSHLEMEQSWNQTSIQYSDLHSMVAALNESLTDEVEGLWANLTKNELVLGDVRTELKSLNASVTALKNSANAESKTKTEDSTPAAATPTAPPTSPATTAATPTPGKSMADMPVEHDEQVGTTPTVGMASTTQQVPAATTTQSEVSAGTTTAEPMGGHNDTSEVTTTASTDSDKITTPTATIASDEKTVHGGSSGSQILQEIYENFDLSDTNKDGGLSLEEFKEGNMPLSEDAFDLLDRDHDGLVDKAEIQYALDLLTHREPSN